MDEMQMPALPEPLTDRELWSLRNRGNDCERAADEIDRLRAEVEALRADAERLNWIQSIASQERGKVELARSILGTGFEVGEWPSMRVTVKAGDLRAAIDAARAEAKGGDRE